MDELEAAAEALRAGRLVVFPTETVYGLGANALDAQAIARLYAAKGRPADNPLIVHVPDEAAARALAARWPPAAARLAAAFWPGPLTLVVPRGPGIPDATTAGLDSVALRVPAHAMAQRLMRAAGVPVAAPSANRSGRPSPTRVQDARADLGDLVAVYLDGGPTRIGLESTVVDVGQERPVLLRLGGISRAELEAVVGRVDVDTASARSPGTRHRHYAPRARVVLAEPDQLEARYRSLAGAARVAVLAGRPDRLAGTTCHVPGDLSDAGAWAHHLFALLRDLEEHDVILVELPAAGGLGDAVRDRLRRAAEGP